PTPADADGTPGTISDGPDIEIQPTPAAPDAGTDPFGAVSDADGAAVTSEPASMPAWQSRLNS
ncbi:MAG: hypothetical protein ACTHU7_08125, partial [Microbacterium sp.]